MAAHKPIWEIRLLVETDDPSELERLADAVALVACPEESSDPDHTCRIPWFVVSSELDDGDAWR
jgi:hypothetical protein